MKIFLLFSIIFSYSLFGNTQISSVTIDNEAILIDSINASEITKEKIEITKFENYSQLRIKNSDLLNPIRCQPGNAPLSFCTTQESPGIVLMTLPKSQFNNLENFNLEYDTKSAKIVFLKNQDLGYIEKPIKNNLEFNIKNKNENQNQSKLILVSTISILFMLIILGLLSYFRKKGIIQAPQKQIKIHEFFPLGGSKKLALIEVNKEKHLIGITDHNIQWLLNITHETQDLTEVKSSVVGSQFSDYISNKEKIEENEAQKAVHLNKILEKQNKDYISFNNKNSKMSLKEKLIRTRTL